MLYMLAEGQCSGCNPSWLGHTSWQQKLCCRGPSIAQHLWALLVQLAGSSDVALGLGWQVGLPFCKTRQLITIPAKHPKYSVTCQNVGCRQAPMQSPHNAIKTCITLGSMQQVLRLWERRKTGFDRCSRCQLGPELRRNQTCPICCWPYRRYGQLLSLCWPVHFS